MVGFAFRLPVDREGRPGNRRKTHHQRGALNHGKTETASGRWPKQGRDAGYWGGVRRMNAGRTIVVKDRLRVHIRWMIRRDMNEVLQTENESFDFAWSEEDFLRCLRQRNCIGMVAELDERVVGFMIYELHKTKLHVLNFAVAPDYRRSGIGTQMVMKLVGKLSSHRRTKITLAIRESNLAAQLFFRSQGFSASKVLRAYYEDSGEDAYMLNFRLSDYPELEEEDTLPMNRIVQFEEN
jgi:[ribosomal protein S18]-alanine N-acetyltransferase